MRTSARSRRAASLSPCGCPDRSNAGAHGLLAPAVASLAGCLAGSPSHGGEAAVRRSLSASTSPPGARPGSSAVRGAPAGCLAGSRAGRISAAGRNPRPPSARLIGVPWKPCLSTELFPVLRTPSRALGRRDGIANQRGLFQGASPRCRWPVSELVGTSRARGGSPEDGHHLAGRRSMLPPPGSPASGLAHASLGASSFRRGIRTRVRRGDAGCRPPVALQRLPRWNVSSSVGLRLPEVVARRSKTPLAVGRTRRDLAQAPSCAGGGPPTRVSRYRRRFRARSLPSAPPPRRTAGSAVGDLRSPRTTITFLRAPRRDLIRFTAAPG